MVVITAGSNILLLILVDIYVLGVFENLRCIDIVYEHLILEKVR